MRPFVELTCRGVCFAWFASSAEISPGLSHVIQHLIAPRGRGVDVVIRVVAIGTANNSRQKSRLRQGQIRHVFTEVGVSRFAKTVDRKACLLAQVNLIAVESQRFVLWSNAFRESPTCKPRRLFAATFSRETAEDSSLTAA